MRILEYIGQYPSAVLGLAIGVLVLILAIRPVRYVIGESLWWMVKWASIFVLMLIAWTAVLSIIAVNLEITATLMIVVDVALLFWPELQRLFATRVEQD